MKTYTQDDIIQICVTCETPLDTVNTDCADYGHANPMAAWSEYDSAAEYLAKRGLTGKEGDPLPTGLSTAAYTLINNDLEAFQERVRDTAYALAMEKHAN